MNFSGGNKGALRIPSLSFQYPRRPGCTAKLLCFLIAGRFESHRLHQGFLGPTRRHGLQNVPATWVTLLGRTRCQAAPPFVPAVQLHRLLWPRPKLQVGGQKKGREFSTERLRFQALLRVFAWLSSPSF